MYVTIFDEGVLGEDPYDRVWRTQFQEMSTIR